mgnify:FL=1|jgi:hypothetical protein|tara:strand:+ start:237 stop:539 length:303 start_codon:yes stop_codon:yes gene_type:complete
MALGFSSVITGFSYLSDLMSKNQEGSGSIYGESAGQVRDRVNFERFKRDSLAPEEAGQVKANEAISYSELSRIWDSILPNAYADLIERVEQPSFSSRKDI